MKTLFSLFAPAVALLVASSIANAQIRLTKVAEIPFTQQFRALRISGDYLYSTGNGFRVFDISNRTNPVNVATVAFPNGGKTVSVSGNYAYVIGSEGFFGGGALHIFDVSTPANPTEVGGVAGTEHYSVSVLGRYAFVDAGIYDISDPTNPVLLGQLPGVGPSPVSGGNFLSASGHFAYVAQNYGDLIGLIVFDIRDPTQPVRVGQASSGSFALEVAPNDHYAFIAAPTNCGFAAFDISNPTNPVPVNCLFSTSERVTISGNFAYLNYEIVDVSHPTNLTRVASMPAYDYCAAVTGNYAYVAEDLFLRVYRLDVAPPPLSITATRTNTLVLAWPAPTIAFAVQQTQDLNGSSWVMLTNTPSVVASKNQVLILTPVQNTFYRLAVSSQ